MAVFERLTKSPKALGAFLRALPVLDGPWDVAFQRQFCKGCIEITCDTCPNEAYRNNPEWWLKGDRIAENKRQTGGVLDKEG